MIGRRGHERVGSCASLGRVSRHPGPVPSRPRYGVLEDYSREAPITRARHMAVSRPVDVHGGGMSVDRDHYNGQRTGASLGRIGSLPARGSNRGLSGHLLQGSV